MELLNPNALNLGNTLPLRLEAFDRSLRSLVSFSKGERFCVAVSGGADSLALTLLMERWRKTCDCRLFAVTVDHHLRAESTREAKQVQEWLASYGIAHHTVEWDSPFSKKEKVSHHAARQARYALLIKWCEDNDIPYLLTAHHQEDLAETVLMRFLNGSGINGLAGIAPLVITPKVKIARPLLAFSKASLQAWLQKRDQSWIEDPSNKADAYKRIRLRKFMQQEGLTPARLIATCAKMAQARDYFERETTEWLANHAHRHEAGFYLIDWENFKALHCELQARALKNALQDIGAKIYPPREESLNAFLTRLKSGFRTQTVHGCVLSLWRDKLLIARESRSIMKETPLKPAEVNYWDNRFEIESRQEGLTIDKLGMENWTLLKKKIDKKIMDSIPAKIKPTLPAIFHQGQVIAAPHLGWNPNDISFKIRFFPQSALFKPIFTIA